MASIIQYNSLTPVPAPPAEPTQDQLNIAKREYDTAENGDRNPLPPPFTYGKIYQNNVAIEKLSNAPIILRAELETLIKNLPQTGYTITISSSCYWSSRYPSSKSCSHRFNSTGKGHPKSQTIC